MVSGESLFRKLGLFGCTTLELALCRSAAAWSGLVPRMLAEPCTEVGGLTDGEAVPPPKLGMSCRAAVTGGGESFCCGGEAAIN